MRWLVAAALVAGSLAGRPQAQTPTLDQILERLATYLDGYEQSLASVVAREDYEQKVQMTSYGRRFHTDQRVMESEFLFLRGAVDEHWLGVRNALVVNGKAIGSADEQLANRLTRAAGSPLDEARRIAAENARYNIGDVPRTINVPTNTLEFLARRNRSHFRFKMAGEERVRERLTRRVEFNEVTRPTLIRTKEGANQRARGSVWVDPSDGSVLRTMLQLGDDDPAEDWVRTTIVANFDRVPGLTFLVPVTLFENYNRLPHSDGLAYQVNGYARYSDFKHFEVGARMVQ